MHMIVVPTQAAEETDIFEPSANTTVDVFALMVKEAPGPGVLASAISGLEAGLSDGFSPIFYFNSK